MKDMRVSAEGAGVAPELEESFARMLDGATIITRSGQRLSAQKDGFGEVVFQVEGTAPLIGEPSNAPPVAQLMEDLNSALGNAPLGAEPNTPRAVWERLLQQVRGLADPLRRA